MDFSSTLENPSTSQASSDEKLDSYRIRQEEKIFSSLSLPAPIFIAYLMGFIFTSFQFFSKFTALPGLEKPSKKQQQTKASRAFYGF